MSHYGGWCFSLRRLYQSTSFLDTLAAFVGYSDWRDDTESLY